MNMSSYILYIRLNIISNNAILYNEKGGRYWKSEIALEHKENLKDFLVKN